MASSSSVERRTQRERTEQTTNALLDAARELFAKDGYDATSLDAIAAAAGVTKGGLYHHFAGKRQLFRAVIHREDHRLAGLIRGTYERKSGDAWAAFAAGALVFLDGCLEPEAQQIMLLDGPSALGKDVIRTIEGESTFDAFQEGLRQAIKDGRIDKRPVDPLARMLFGAIREASMAVAGSANEASAAKAARAELRRLLSALER